MKIAVIEDSKKIGYILFKAFEKEKIDVVLFESLKDTKKIRPNEFAAYIVDYNLKDGIGLDFVKTVRERKEKTPILMLTVRDSLEDKLSSFEAGVDDYLTKPFELAELIARMRTLINRNATITSSKIDINGILFDFERMEIKYKGNKIPFSKKEYQVIKYLIYHKGHIIDKDKILENIWVNSDEKDPNIVNVYINRIRNKLRETNAPDFIENIRGFGYRIK